MKTIKQVRDQVTIEWRDINDQVGWRIFDQVWNQVGLQVCNYVDYQIWLDTLKMTIEDAEEMRKIS